MTSSTARPSMRISTRSSRVVQPVRLAPRRLGDEAREAARVAAVEWRIDEERRRELSDLTKQVRLRHSRSRRNRGAEGADDRDRTPCIGRARRTHQPRPLACSRRRCVLGADRLYVCRFLRGRPLECVLSRGRSLRGAVLQDEVARRGLTGAVCTGTNFKLADLRGADLSAADLRGAKFEGAKVFGANVQGALVGENPDDAVDISPTATARSSTRGRWLAPSRRPRPSTTPSASTARRAPAPCAPPTARARPACAPAARARAAACASSRTARGRASRPRAPRARRSPARVPCAQSAKRHCAASDSTSPNAASRPDSASQSCSSRMPGVSSTSPPSGSGTSWRCVVVCRPRPSSRISCVASSSSPSERVDERRLADAGRAEQRRGAPGRDVAAHGLDAVARAARSPRARARRRRRTRPRSTRDSTSSQRSAFVSSTTGWAPLSQASVR